MTEKLEVNLYKYRNLANLYQYELAKLVGVSRIAISQIERGKAIPSVLLSLKIAEVLNTDVNKIFKITNK